MPSGLRIAWSWVHVFLMASRSPSWPLKSSSWQSNIRQTVAKSRRDTRMAQKISLTGALGVEKMIAVIAVSY